MTRRLLKIILLVIILAIPLLLWKQRERILYISKNTNADIIIIEGWLKKSGLEFACDYILENKPKMVLVCGMPYPEESKKFELLLEENKDRLSPAQPASNWIGLYVDGLLVYRFTPPLALSSEIEITFGASGSTYFGAPAHFNMLINDSIVNGGFVEQNTLFNFIISTDTLKYLAFDFNNDNYCNPQNDRNLVLTNISLAGVPLKNYSNLEMYKVSSIEYPFYPEGVASEAEETVKYLEQLGLNGEVIETIPSETTSRNRTLANAKAIKKWLDNSDIKIKKVDVITANNHSRRSYVNYKNALKGTEVGIISPLQSDANCVTLRSGKQEAKFYLEELASLLVTYLYWIFH